MRAFLQLDNLWDVMKGEVSDKQKIEKVLSNVTLCINPINFSHLKVVKMAKEAWQQLKNAFEDSGHTMRVGLLRTLVTMRLENCRSVDEYVENIISTAHKLNVIDFEVKDKWIGTLLLEGLPDQIVQ
ncbi:hypothetical protein PR048_010946 [Dryococelus australis]|uniref:UBN2 domain-containing protein n=1 Tax=Dryococelus australis TaxID=614101 RepID=A0ABQ9HKF3_9NEOP|nr:hypothetical protein PR048_010946 [Dryococelus australis]